jgi:hypothetical protein
VENERRVELPPGVLAVRVGPGANCSSIGSVVDILFATAVTAGFVYALVATALPDRATKAEDDETEE